jgi:hypothetical protein
VIRGEATINDIAALIDTGRFADALTHCARVLAANPRNVPAHINHGAASLGLGDAVAGRRAFNRAINEDPTVAAAWNGLGNALYDLGRPGDAAQAFHTAASLSPDPATPRYHRAMALLAAGDYAQGWAEWEYRATPLTLRRHDAPPWNGDALEGRHLLISAEQGYGDMIQFARFVPLAAARGGTVTFEAPAELLALFAPFADTVTLTATEDGPVGDIDCHIHLMSLAGVLGVRAHCVPAATPYIAAPPARVAAWRDAMADDGGLRIGLAWAGRPSYPQDAQRSMNCAHLTPLTALDELSLYSMQKDPATRPITDALAASLTDDFSRLPNDFSETAAIIENLDLIITVDSAIGHIAGALGKPVWVLLPFAADWRWMRGRDDTPWYPAMRLFRQDAAGDWAGVMARVCAALMDTGC